MAKQKRRVAGWAGVSIAVLVVAAMAALARPGGASWQDIAWGVLGLAALSAVARFFEWLLHWRPDRPE